MNQSSGKTLFAYYDLQICTVTFDFFTFLLRAEIERRDRGYAHVHVVFVPGADDGFRMMHHNGSVSRWRLRNILVAGCAMLPSINGVTVCESRAKATDIEFNNPDAVFPIGYTTKIFDSQEANDAAIDAFMFAGLAALHVKGVEIPHLMPSDGAKEWVRSWLGRRAEGRKPVIITLRESPHDPARNSRLDEWVAFADGLDRAEFHPIFVRDTDAVFTELPPQLQGHPICDRASLEVDIRMALYEVAYANLLVSNGPLALCYLNPRVRYLVFKLFHPGQREDERATFAVYGIPQSGQTPMATPFQLNVWQDDRRENISNAFEELSGRIEAAAAAGTLDRSDRRRPMSTADAIASATAMHSVGRYDAAASIYKHLSEVEPDHPDIAGMLGLARHHQGQTNEAASHLQRAVSLAPANHIHWFNLGVVYREAGDTDLAISAFKKVLEINPEIYGAHENLGDIFAKQEDWKHAALHYSSVIQLHAGDLDVLSRLARCLECLGRKGEAYELYQRAAAAEKARLTEREDAKKAEIFTLNRIHIDMHPYFVLPRTGRDLEERLAL